MKLILLFILILAHSYTVLASTDFTISRTYPTDAQPIYDAMVDPAKYVQWMGPDSAEMVFMHSKVTVGKMSQWSMKMKDGTTKYGQLHYKAMKPGRLFSYTQNFCDKDGNFIKAPFSPTYPDRLLTTMTLTYAGNKQTALTVKWEIVGKPTKAEIKTFNDMRPFMVKGWTESLNKLSILLKNLQQITL